MCQRCSEYCPYFMVTDAVWERVVRPGERFVCPRCIGLRLGRELSPFDFPAVPVNVLALMAPESLLDEYCTVYHWTKDDRLMRTRAYFREFWKRNVVVGG